jgi:putative oxidoreductase
VVHFGVRLAIGVIFIVHGSSKFGEGFVGFLSQLGMPPEMQIPLALAEVVPGILVIVGVLSRISSAMLSIIMLGAIFYVKQASNLTGQGGFEFDLILLAANLLIIVVGPGRVSISQVLKKIPRVLQ